MGTVIIAFINCAQALFSIFLLLRKKQKRTADRILCIWLFVLLLSFALDIVKYYFHVKGFLWPVSNVLALAIPPLLYLYSKYIVGQGTGFQRRDFFHFAPFLCGCLLVIFLSCQRLGHSFVSNQTYFNGQIILRSLLGYGLILSMWTYCGMTLVGILGYQKRMKNAYSFASSKINLNWMLFLVVFFLLFYNYTIIVAAYQVKGYSLGIIGKLGNPVSLLITYVLSYFGLRQQLLITEYAVPMLNQDHGHVPDATHYVKSGLKDSQASHYARLLVDSMEQQKAWKDTELSIAGLSFLTGIPKHHITQTLNEYMGKNFYTFVNEYRAEYAKHLISSKQHANWSFVAIAFESGFNSKTAFNVFFKKYTGQTPSEYRRSHLPK